MLKTLRNVSVLSLLVVLFGCTTTTGSGVAPEPVINSADQGDYILVLASDRTENQAVLNRFENQAAELNATAASRGLRPYFSARDPRTVSGYQLVYGRLGDDFGVIQDDSVRSALRGSYPDAYWVDIR